MNVNRKRKRPRTTASTGPGGVTIKSDKQIEIMRRAGQVVAQAKARMREAARPGVTTRELDRVAEDTIRRLGATPSFKGYAPRGMRPFPATICASVNEEIVHGIPGGRKLKSGDILSVDVGAIVDGFHGDSAFTMGIGLISDEARHLIEATRQALERGIAQVRAGARVGDVSHAVQSYAEGLGYSVVRQYVGHGIGRSMHEEPQVPNYGEPRKGFALRKGMAIAIEPMLNVGGWETTVLKDGWTVVTADGSLSAHFEDTVAITAKGAEVLTRLSGELQ